MTIAAEMCCHCEPQPSRPDAEFVIQHDFVPSLSSRTDGSGCFASVAFEDNGDNAASDGIDDDEAAAASEAWNEERASVAISDRLFCCLSCTLLSDFLKTKKRRFS